MIVFTASSGMGYGLLALLGLAGPVGLLPAEPGFGIAAFVLAFGLVTAGLLASLLHLGHPERAWRALSQWRSSWLSREGVAAVATYLPAGLYAAGWVLLGRNGGAAGLLGLLTAAGAAATVFCTAMIYASLRAVPRWHSPWTVPNYAALALAGGCLWLSALAHPFGLASRGLLWLTVLCVAGAGALRWVSWRRLDRAALLLTSGDATGLAGFGQVRLLDAPHTEENYLLREMGFVVARKHARRLRGIAVIAAFVAPLTLTLLAAASPAIWLASLLALLAAISASLGVLVERWLFFAEAKHTVSLYYGAAAV